MYGTAEPDTAGLSRAALELSASIGMARDAARHDAISAAAVDVIESDRLIDGEYPLFATRGKGGHVWDVDGNRYLDFILAYGTIILGHANDVVDDAVVAEIREGFALSMIKPTQSRLTKRLIELIPNAERALLLKTGSDATSAAVRLCRVFTGRDIVIRWGYNGWHDWCAVRRSGIPSVVDEGIDSFTYNDLATLEAALIRHRGQVACILTMPFEVELPDPGFLKGMRELADRHDVPLVLDEIRSGFRLGLGGAQEFYGVRADLVTVGKAMSNGYALSAVAGRADLLDGLGGVHISSTFYANSLSMAAALATIDVLASTSALSHVRALGLRLQEGLRIIIAETRLPAEVVGAPQMPFLRFPDGPSHSAAAKRLFYTGTVRRGILFHPNHHWYVCAEMTEADIDEALAASREAATEAMAALGLRDVGA